ncbi:ttr-35 [Pristionchus pacificus]|uniref:Ttr-35 n=1 Tax=Pristionchus pacificus TaxID=54126 RepID=A0A2A6CU36_PRIPA|nr:ttr-35 [Pristionchus pacificus]|eukprot:PDM81744.1 ttr-35 [Pristionchus pacificus]
MKLILFPLLIMAAFAWGIDIPEQFTGEQSYRVSGVFMCGDSPAKGVQVKLVDDDFGPNPDDEMDQTYTDDEGRFVLSGRENELTTIDPHLKVYHDCNDGLIPCQRRWKFELPNKYITKGTHPAKTLDIGVWNLEAKMPDESHDCLH